MTVKQELSQDALNAKALSLIEDRKARGILNVEDPKKLIAALAEKYGNRVYDIVLAAIVRPYKVAEKAGIKAEFDKKKEKLTSAKLLKHLADNKLDEQTLNQCLQKDASAPKKEAPAPKKDAPAPQMECLDVKNNFPHNDLSYFKTEKVPTNYAFSPFGYSQTSIETWAKKNLGLSAERNGNMTADDNPLAAAFLQKLNLKGKMYPEDSGNLENMTYSLKDLKAAAKLTNADISRILGVEAVTKADQADVRVTRKAALYLLENNILRQYHAANPRQMDLSTKIQR